jgi:hypothetical protein
MSHFETFIVTNTHFKSEPGGSVGIATDYGMDGLGVESR